MDKKLLLITFIVVMAFALIGCDSNNINCEPENCNWVYVEPHIDYSLPQFFIEGVWVKDNGSERLSVNNYAHFWKRFSASCPNCRPAVDAPMPVIIFHQSGSLSFISFDGTVMEIADMNQSLHSFSATVSDNTLTVSGLTGTLQSLDQGFIDVSRFNGTYSLLSRPAK